MTENENLTEVTLVVPASGEVEVTQVIEVVSLDRPFLTTSFYDYTVTEGLLLMLVLLIFIKMCINIVKGGFSWLLW